MQRTPGLPLCSIYVQASGGMIIDCKMHSRNSALLQIAAFAEKVSSIFANKYRLKTITSPARTKLTKTWKVGR